MRLWRNGFRCVCIGVPRKHIDMNDLESLRARRQAIVDAAQARGDRILNDIDNANFVRLSDEIEHVERRQSLHKTADRIFNASQANKRTTRMFEDNPNATYSLEEILSNQFGDYEFQHNAWAFRAEERFGLGVQYPKAVCVVTGLSTTEAAE